MALFHVFRGNLRDVRELSFCGPCRPCFRYRVLFSKFKVILTISAHQSETSYLVIVAIGGFPLLF